MKTFIIAEAGVNHNGSLGLAKKMINAAVEAGTDAVKFQTFKKEVKSAIGNPDMLMDTIKGRKNAFKIIKGRRLKITYKPEDGILTVITAMVKGE